MRGSRKGQITRLLKRDLEDTGDDDTTAPRRADRYAAAQDRRDFVNHFVTIASGGSKR